MYFRFSHKRRFTTCALRWDRVKCRGWTAALRIFKTKNIRSAESELRNLIKSQHILYVEAELWNFKSLNILCAEAELQVTEYSACGISLVPHAMVRMTRVRRGHRSLGQSHLGGAIIYCSVLAMAPTGIFCVFSPLLSSSNKSADVWPWSGH